MNTHMRSCRLKVSASVVVAAVCAAAALAEEQGEWKAPARAVRMQNPVTADQNSIAAGQAVYMKECRACHGQQGKGDGPGAAAQAQVPEPGKGPGQDARKEGIPARTLGRLRRGRWNRVVHAIP